MIFVNSSHISPKKGVLLVQFGTPYSTSRTDLKKYLESVLKDHFFTFFPSRLQSTLLRAFILPFVLNSTQKRYQSIWTKEGSPLLVHSYSFTKKVAKILPSNIKVSLGMLYGGPSIEEAFNELFASPLETLLIVPLFPQKNPLTTAAKKRCFDLISQIKTHTKVKFVSSFSQEPFFLNAVSKKIILCRPEEYDHVLFSFHGLPRSYHSYQSDCIETARELAKRASLDIDNFSVSFQSKVGFSRWLSPSTKEELQRLFQQKKKRVLVVAPSFVADCSETLGEIGCEYRTFFKSLGGEDLSLVECVNDFDPWVEGASSFFLNKLS